MIKMITDIDYLEEMIKHYKIDHSCKRPFCTNKVELENELGFCLECIDDLKKILGAPHRVITFDNGRPSFRLDIKDAIEILLVSSPVSRNMEGFHFMIRGFFNDAKPSDCEKKIKTSNSQKGGKNDS
jgi:hypothetical protein